MEDTSAAGRRRGVQRRDAQRRLLDAAIAQLADEGARGLTHRKVEQRAGLAQGSAKYYFGTLDALTEAVLVDLAETDLPLVLEVAPEEQPDDPTHLIDRAQEVIDAVLARPDRVRARLHLYLHAATRPALQRHVTAAREQFISRIAATLPGPDSEVGARFVCAVLDGMVLDQVSAPSTAMELHAARYVLAAGAAGASLSATRAPRPG